MLRFARSLAEEAGRRLLAAQSELDRSHIEFKGRRDMVTAADRSVESFLAAEIQARFPDDAILAEESIRRAGESGRVWILDPLDGTTNFVHGHPMYCTSIAVAEGYGGLPEANDAALAPGASGFFKADDDLRLQLAVVAAPALGETYWGSRGGGAYVNGSRLQVSGTDDLSRSLAATGFAYRRNELANPNLGNFCRLTLRVQGIRRGGAASLDLCYVAAGRFDAFWEMYLKPWDVAAGILLVEEAGGRVTGFAEGRSAIEGVEVLASNGVVHEDVRRLLSGPDPQWAIDERAGRDG